MAEAHLTRAELTAWRDAGEGDRARLVTHLAVCAECREVVAEVERARPAERPPQRLDAADFVARGYRAGASGSARWGRASWLAAAAAVLVVALVPGWYWRLDEGTAITRGGSASVSLVRPVETAVAAAELTFEWTGAPGARVRLNVVDLGHPGAPLIEHEVTGQRYEPTTEERQRFRQGQTLHWYIEVLSGAAIGPSPTARFSVR